jgi:hypothetical protein
MKLTGAAILVSRGMKVLQAAPAGEEVDIRYLQIAVPFRGVDLSSVVSLGNGIFRFIPRAIRRSAAQPEAKEGQRKGRATA